MKKVVQAAYSNTSIKVIHNIHWRGGEQAEVVVVYEQLLQLDIRYELNCWRCPEESNQNLGQDLLTEKALLADQKQRGWV